MGHYREYPPEIIIYWSFVNEFHSIILLFLEVLEDGN